MDKLSVGGALGRLKPPPLFDSGELLLVLLPAAGGPLPFPGEILGCLWDLWLAAGAGFVAFAEAEGVGAPGCCRLGEVAPLTIPTAVAMWVIIKSSCFRRRGSK